MVSINDVILWYGYFSLIGLPILLFIIRELRRLIVKGAEAKADDGKIDAQEWLDIITSALWGVHRVVGEAIRKLQE